MLLGLVLLYAYRRWPRTYSTTHTAIRYVVWYGTWPLFLFAEAWSRWCPWCDKCVYGVPGEKPAVLVFECRMHRALGRAHWTVTEFFALPFA